MGRVLLACWLVWWAMPNIFTHLGGRTAGGGNPVQMPLFGEEGTQASESLPVPVLSTNVCSLAFFRPNRPFLGELGTLPLLEPGQTLRGGRR